MIYRIVHKTSYQYEYAVSVGNHATCLTPRSTPYQRCTTSDIRIAPIPECLHDQCDYFGNLVQFFAVQEPHETLEIEARSEVIVEPRSWPDSSPPWESASGFTPLDASEAALEASQFVFESPRINPSREFADYARQSFSPRRPLTEALSDLTARIYREFRFDSKATNVRTPPEEVLQTRRGVCQDFAHVQIACLRSLGLAARYVSGYLRTIPPPGRPRLVGADASHAWVSVFSPTTGWLDVDPTNNLIPSDSHVTVGWGRDYGDVSPVRGVILGGRKHTLKVGVDMLPLESSEAAS